MNRAKIAFSGFAAGAAVMYLSDPDRGRRRRALARDQLVKTWNRFFALADKAQRDLANRSHGALSSAKSVFQKCEVDDDVLAQRIKTRLGRVVSHPHAIEVQSSGGTVVLKGSVLENETQKLLAAVRAIPGVSAILNQLESHSTEEKILSHQQSVGRVRRSEIMQQNWTPSLRMAAGGMGVGLLLYGVRKDGIAGIVTGIVGTAMLGRAVCNRELKGIIGIGNSAHVVEFDKTVHIQAPVPDVFAFWSQYERFPHFMTHLKEVRDLGEGKSHWVAEGPAGVPISWDAEITERVENKRLSWRSVPGSTVQTEGVVRFDENSTGGTRVTVRMCYKPPAGMIGHTIASLFGADPKREMDEDMVRLKSLIETGKTRAHGVPVTREQVKGPAAT